MKIDETRTLRIEIPVLIRAFRDEKEVVDLFTYVYEKHDLHKNFHFPMTFKKVLEYSQDKYIFTLVLDERYDECLEERRADLSTLIELYNKIESEYLQFRKFGDIESKMLIRRS